MAVRLAGAICVLVVFCLQQAGFSATSVTISRNTREQNEKLEAERIWEQAIVAKGGRERLYAVRNVAVSTKGIYRTARGKENKVREEELYVFPDKFWAWSD